MARSAIDTAMPLGIAIQDLFSIHFGYLCVTCIALWFLLPRHSTRLYRVGYFFHTTMALGTTTIFRSVLQTPVTFGLLTGMTVVAERLFGGVKPVYGRG